MEQLMTGQERPRPANRTWHLIFRKAAIRDPDSVATRQRSKPAEPASPLTGISPHGAKP
jgi:hypothetical protein